MDKHQKVLESLPVLFRRLKRWPTISELVKHNKRTPDSIRHSLESLRKAKKINVIQYGRGIPPSIVLAGYDIILVKMA